MYENYRSEHLRTFIMLRDQKIMKFLCLVLNFSHIFMFKLGRRGKLAAEKIRQ